MVSLHDQYEEDWIIRCFLILACNSLLFPTTSLFISSKDYIVTESLEEVKNYDWCQRLCDDIVAKSEKFMLERARHVATPHIQGCILFYGQCWMPSHSTGWHTPLEVFYFQNHEEYMWSWQDPWTWSSGEVRQFGVTILLRRKLATRLWSLRRRSSWLCSLSSLLRTRQAASWMLSVCITFGWLY